MECGDWVPKGGAPPPPGSRPAGILRRQLLRAAVAHRRHEADGGLARVGTGVGEEEDVARVCGDGASRRALTRFVAALSNGVKNRRICI